MRLGGQTFKVADSVVTGPHLEHVAEGQRCQGRVPPCASPSDDEPVAVDVTALRGSADDVEYTRLDCRVSGREAQSLVRRLKPDIDARKKVLIGFKAGDLYPETFVYENGDRKGQTGVSLKAHLLRITWAKVDGVTVYTAPSDAPTEPADTAPAEAIA